MTSRVLRGVATNVLIALVGAYGLSVSGFIVLRLLFGEPLGFFGLFSSYLHLLILPALILLPVVLLTPRRWLAITLILPFGLFAMSYWRQFLPVSVQTSTDAPRLTLLTFNLHNGNDSGEQVVETIRQAQPDLVALQELTPQITSFLTDLYPYQSFTPRNDFTGQGILSRYPIIAAETWKTESIQGRYQLDINGSIITLFNVHTAYPYVTRLRFNGAKRSQDVSDILNRAADEHGPMLIVGDFNMTDMSFDYGRITALYADAYRHAGRGMGFTFPAYTNIFGLRNVPPLARIDFVFHSSHFQAIQASVGADAVGSDHLPLLATLIFES